MKSFVSMVLALLILSGCATCALAAQGDVVVFADPVFEAKVREMLGRPDGDFLKSECEQVTELYLSNMDYPKDQWGSVPDEEKIHDLGDLKYFPNLIKLEIGQNAVADISPLAELSQLTYLDAAMNQIKDISAIANLTSLEHAVFWENQIADISPVAGLTNLKVFSVFSNQVSDISALAGLTKLTILELHGNPIEDYSPVEAVYPNLEQKDFELKRAIVADSSALDESITEEDAKTAIEITDPVLERKLRELMNKPDGDITVADAKSVSELDLSNEWQPQMPEDQLIYDISSLSYFTNLIKLHLNFNSISDISVLSELTNLFDLEIGGNQIKDLSPLAGLAKMEHLSLFGNGLTDISALAGLVKMNSLHMHGNAISDISALSNMKTLSDLMANDNRISDISPLSGLPLTRLYLANNPIADYGPVEDQYPNLSDKDFEPIFAEGISDEPLAFEDAQFETALRTAMGIYDRPITQKDAYIVQSLEICNDKSEGSQFSNIAPLSYFVNLKSLYFNSNLIADLSPLSGLTKLTSLNVAFNQVADISPLAGLTQLESLQLNNNQINDISALSGLINLKNLDIANNLITDISPLAGLTQLENLSVMIAGIKNSDVSVLLDLPNLRYINLTMTEQQD